MKSIIIFLMLSLVGLRAESQTINLLTSEQKSKMSKSDKIQLAASLKDCKILHTFNMSTPEKFGVNRAIERTFKGALSVGLNTIEFKESLVLDVYSDLNLTGCTKSYLIDYDGSEGNYCYNIVYQKKGFEVKFIWNSDGSFSRIMKTEFSKYKAKEVTYFGNFLFEGLVRSN
jgi:hypothetical protein